MQTAQEVRRTVTDEALSWFDRLKRHYIGRVVIPYAIVIGFVMQVAAHVFPYFGWSGAVLPLVIVLLVSLPVVLVLTWLLARPRDASGSSAWQHQHRKLGTAVSVLVVVLTAVSGFYAWQFSELHAQIRHDPRFQALLQQYANYKPTVTYDTAAPAVPSAPASTH